jgi:hypothetical protein
MLAISNNNYLNTTTPPLRQFPSPILWETHDHDVPINKQSVCIFPSLYLQYLVVVAGGSD